MKLKPVIASDWRRLVEIPDLGELASQTRHHEMVDHGFYKAPDDRWHLWAAIRGTAVGHPICSWSGDSLTGGEWNYEGIALRAKTEYDERVNPENGNELVCAPYFIHHDGRWNCFYNSNGIHRLVSDDGYTFHRKLDANGSSRAFGGGRDPMLIKIGQRWFGYSCVTRVSKDGWKESFVVVHTSRDLEEWSDYTIVSAGGVAGNGAVASESPFVVHRDGYFYLFRASSITFTTFVYRSTTPFNFGVNDDSMLIAELPIKAPEIVEEDGQEYITDLADFDGIKIAKLQWVEDTEAPGPERWIY